MKLTGKLADKEIHPLDAWNDSQVFYLHHLGRAFADLFAVQCYYNYLQKIKSGELKPNEDTKECLFLLYQLHCLTKMNDDLGTFREGDYLSSDQGDLIKQTILILLTKVKRHALSLVETFYPGDEMFDSMIAPTNGDLYSSIISRVYQSGKAFDRAANFNDCLTNKEK